MGIDPTPDRRTVLETVGAVGVLGSIGTVNAIPTRQDADALRVFSDIDIPNVARDVHVQGNHAFVANGEGVTVVDWHDPTRPEVVADVDVPGVGVDDVKMDGDLMAASSQGAEDQADVGTHFYDISDPADPRLLGTFQVLPAGVHNHYLDGDVAYLCKEFPFGDSNLQIVDVSDPTDPTLVTKWAVEDVHPELDTRVCFVHDVVVQGDLAYVAYWDAGTRILDVSDPAEPVEIAGFGEAPDASEPAPGELDFVNPDSPFARRVLGPPGNVHLSVPSPDGEFVYTNWETYVPGGQGPMKVWDVSDLEAPVEVATIEPPDIDVNPPFTLKTSHNFDVTRNRLYTTWYDGGTRIFDVTDPTEPTELSSYNVEGFTFDTAEWARSFTLASVRGVGVLWLHDDRGKENPGMEAASTEPRDIVRGQDAQE